MAKRIVVLISCVAGMFVANLVREPALAQQTISDKHADLITAPGAPPPAWVRVQNRRTISELQGSDEFAGLFWEGVTSRLSAAANFDAITIFQDHLLGNFQTADNPRGILKLASRASFEEGTNEWVRLLDVDELARTEGRNWNFEGARCDLSGRHCLIAFVDADSHRSTIREFDIETRRFVEHGFALSGYGASHSLYWKDRDATYVLANVISSPVRHAPTNAVCLLEWRRGTPLSEAREILCGGPIPDARDELTDTPDEHGRIVYRNADLVSVPDSEQRSLYQLSYGRDVLGQLPQGWKSVLLGLGDTPIAVPQSLGGARIRGVVEGQVIYAESDVRPLASVPVADFVRGTIRPIYLEGTEGAQVQVTRDGLVAVHNSASGTRVASLRFRGGHWHSTPVDAPSNGIIRPLGDGSPSTHFIFQNLVTPPTLYIFNSLDNRLIPAGAQRVDGHHADQYIAQPCTVRSADGDLVHYILAYRRGLPLDGDVPTLVTGYPNSAFRPPMFDRDVVSLWLKRGGAYVLITDVRGEGLVGPARQRGYEDVVAVARDLVRRGITREGRMGLMGHSMGGLMTGVIFNQHPDLFSAYVMENPVLDILTIRSARTATGYGISQTDFRFGDRNDPVNRRYIELTSPLQNISFRDNPAPVLIATSSNDNDVHPASARLFAAELESRHMPYYYWESASGGHSPASGARESAQYAALKFTFLGRRLMGNEHRSAIRALPPREVPAPRAN